MKKLVLLGLVFAFVFHQALAGLKLFHNEKRFIFDIIPKQTKKLSVKCYKDSKRNSVPGFEAGFKQPAVLFEDNLGNTLTTNQLKKQIRYFVKAINTKTTFHSFKELKKEIKNYMKTKNMTYLLKMV